MGVEPTRVADVEWRAPTIDDVERLFDLTEESEASTGQLWRTSAHELEHSMTRPSTDLAHNVRVAVGHNGKFLASAWVQFSSEEGAGHQAVLFTAVRPTHAPIEEVAIAWGDARATEMLGAQNDDLPGIVRVYSVQPDTDRMTRFKRAGFSVVRHFFEMTRSLDEPIPTINLPIGVSLEPWSERWIHFTWETHCKAFADHWGSVPPTLDRWHHRVARPSFRPEHSYVVVAGGEVVAYSFGGIYPQDWEVRGRREGWIDSLGTRLAWRRQGLGSALINTSLHGFARSEDLDHAALGVDAESNTGALGLYERLGFRRVTRTVAMEKTPG